MGNPMVSVIMSVHNGLPFLEEAVESIYYQTFTDYEFIIVDDCSTDGSDHLIKKWEKHDPRVRCLKNDYNKGLTASLNLALSQTQGEFVARMDADDISESIRLEKQVEFLMKNMDYIAVGTSCKTIDSEGRETGQKLIGCDHLEMMMWFLDQNHMIHGSVMFRNLDNIYYDESFYSAQDYDLWTRLIRRGKLANLSECLYSWRIHGEAVTAHYYSEQKMNAQLIAEKHAQYIYDTGFYDTLLWGFLFFSDRKEKAARLGVLLKSLAFQKLPDKNMRIKLVQIMGMPYLFLKKYKIDLGIIKPVVGNFNFYFWLFCRRFGPWGCHLFNRIFRLKSSIYLYL